ncbi:MAG: uracil-DNA glycosylase [Rhodobacter sp.]|nr:uracil-DNA glycosylase [Rhodobacter sp.]
MRLDTGRLGAWRDLPFFAQDLPDIAAALGTDTKVILPPAAQVFAALELTQPDNTRVVILGQDPYPTPGHAHGLAFSVEPGVELPASLRNIFKEIREDLGGVPRTGDLRPWACQGVLLLNTVLTVPAGQANGHRNLGWQALTRQVMQRLDTCPRAFLLCGKQAQQTAAVLNGTQHFTIETAHPSPLSARHGFFGSRPFSQVNAWLVARGQTPIDWIGA